MQSKLFLQFNRIHVANKSDTQRSTHRLGRLYHHPVRGALMVTLFPCDKSYSRSFQFDTVNLQTLSTGRRRTALSGLCPDLLCSVCRSKSSSNSEFGHSKTLKISDFDGQTPYSKPGQNPDSAVRRRLLDRRI